MHASQYDTVRNTYVQYRMKNPLYKALIGNPEKIVVHPAVGF